MHAERDVLVRSVFPDLRRRAAPHCIHLQEVELRWGVTEEESGRAATLCLAEVDRSHMMVAILGQRYGLVPDPPALPDLPQYEWVQKILLYSFDNTTVLFFFFFFKHIFKGSVHQTNFNHTCIFAVGRLYIYCHEIYHSYNGCFCVLAQIGVRRPVNHGDGNPSLSGTLWWRSKTADVVLLQKSGHHQVFLMIIIIIIIYESCFFSSIKTNIMKCVRAREKLIYFLRTVPVAWKSHFAAESKEAESKMARLKRWLHVNELKVTDKWVVPRAFKTCWIIGNLPKVSAEVNIIRGYIYNLNSNIYYQKFSILILYKFSWLHCLQLIYNVWLDTFCTI